MYRKVIKSTFAVVAMLATVVVLNSEAFSANSCKSLFRAPSHVYRSQETFHPDEEILPGSALDVEFFSGHVYFAAGPGGVAVGEIDGGADLVRYIALPRGAIARNLHVTRDRIYVVTHRPEVLVLDREDEISVDVFQTSKPGLAVRVYKDLLVVAEGNDRFELLQLPAGTMADAGRLRKKAIRDLFYRDGNFYEKEPEKRRNPHSGLDRRDLFSLKIGDNRFVKDSFQDEDTIFVLLQRSGGDPLSLLVFRTGEAEPIARYGITGAVSSITVLKEQLAIKNNIGNVTFLPRP